jgi:minor histocompatibility antigen H13
MALLRGELSLLWSYNEGETKTDLKDDTIEPPSEAAIKAKQAVASGQAEHIAQTVAQPAEDEGANIGGDAVLVEDHSWMEDNKGVSTGRESGKTSKKRTKKKD